MRAVSPVHACDFGVTKHFPYIITFDPQANPTKMMILTSQMRIQSFMKG